MSPLELTRDTVRSPVAQGAELRVAWPTENVSLVSRNDLTEQQLQTIEQLAFEFGEAPESYNIMVSESSVLFTPCGNGAISVIPDGKYWHIPGSLLAPAELKPRIIGWLKGISEASGKTLLLYSIRPDLLPVFRDAGFEVNMLGVEPTMELGDIDWSGSKLSWVRRQTSFCKRAGLEIAEIDQEDQRVAMGDELNAILMEDLADRTFPEPLRLLEGEFDPHRLKRRRLFVARDKVSGTVAGFLACSPMLNGTEWAFETYRKRNDAPRGTIAFLYREVIDRLQSEGARRVSLCLVPGKHVDHPDYRCGPAVVRHLLKTSYSHMSFFFNVQGQDYFKQRFRPNEEARYTCVSTVSSVRTLFSFLKTTGALSPCLSNMTRNIWQSIRGSLRKKRH